MTQRALRPRRHRQLPFAALMAILAAVLLTVFIASFAIGRWGMSPAVVVDIIRSQFMGVEPYWQPAQETVVMEVRLPRILLAIIAGGTLSLAGASYQTLFKNPMVSPDILGVSAGAGFGAAAAMLMNLPQSGIQVCAFAMGLLAVGLSFFISRVFGDRSIIVLILAGMVVSGFFQALVSVAKLWADTDSQLPSITFWLMGSLGKAGNDDIVAILPAVLIALILLYFFRSQIDALSCGEDEARTIGVNVGLVKGVVVVASTLMTVVTVSLCGIVGWVGLIVPHIARILTGASYPKLAGASFLTGAVLLLVIDDVIRGIPGAELPLGVLTALIGTPVFVVLLSRARKGW